MAITATHYRLFKSLPLPRGGSLLEIGEANWYGDVEPISLLDGCDMSAAETVKVAAAGGNLFRIARAMYAALFAPSLIQSIDFNGTERAIRHDLNEPIGPWTIPLTEPGDGKFDLIINHGTAEHIFNISQVFRTMHDACIDGGLMVHDAPFHGWIDHGFYCLQPTLFYDLAMTNNYEIVKVAIHEIKSQQIIPVESREHVPALAEAGKIPMNAMLFVALRKLGNYPFAIPMQGHYAGTLGPNGKRAWEELR